MPWILKVRSEFNATHGLKKYRDKPEPLHSHSYKVLIEILIEKLNKEEYGIDFMAVKRKLDEILPHGKNLNEFFEFTTSTENIAKWIYRELKKTFPVYRVVLWESNEFGVSYKENDF